MAKQETIRNVFESGALDVYDRKYLKYFSDFTDRASAHIFDALRSKDIDNIETCLKDISNTANNFTMLIGIICMIIEKERLYEDTEYGVSYLRYVDHLFNDLNIPMSTLSTAKTMAENFLTYHKQLVKAGFQWTRNSNKLLHLPEALDNHQEDEVFTRIANDTYKNFRDWAGRKNIARPRGAAPDARVDAVIKGNKLFINGKNVLNFPPGTKTNIKGLITDDLCKTFSIREGGGEPYITETYGRGEQMAIENFKKKYRAKK